MKPRHTKFGMQLPYGIIYAFILWIFEFPILGVLGIFLKKHSYLGTRYVMFGRMRPRLTKFGMQLSNGIIYAYIIRIFEFPIFGRFLGDA